MILFSRTLKTVVMKHQAIENQIVLTRFDMLSEERKSFLALAALIEEVKNKTKILTRNEMLRRIGNVAKDLDPSKITEKELTLLYEKVVRLSAKEEYQKKFSSKEDWGVINDPSLTNERMLELALYFWKAMMKKKEVVLEKRAFYRKAGSFAHAMESYGFTFSEGMSLYVEVYSEAMEGLFM